MCNIDELSCPTASQRAEDLALKLDVPWRPADLEQREGRIIRQGNQNRHVEILNYVTEFTYDTVCGSASLFNVRSSCWPRASFTAFGLSSTTSRPAARSRATRVR